METPADAAPGTYMASTGAYWLDTVERLTMAMGDPTGSDVNPVVDTEIR